MGGEGNNVKKPETNKVIQNNPEKNQNNQHNENPPEINLNSQNNENEQNVDFQNEEKDYENNDRNIISSSIKKTGKFVKENDSMLINKKRLRDDKYDPNNPNFDSFNINNNPENSVMENENEDVIKQIEEEKSKLNELLKKLESYKKLFVKEINKKIIKEEGNYVNNNFNMSKQDLKKTIRNIMEASIKENEHTNKIEDIYKDLSPASQTTLQNQFNNLEKKLNEETYLKTQITQNKNIDINPLSKSNENKKTIQLSEIEEEENENEELNNKSIKQKDNMNLNKSEKKNVPNLELSKKYINTDNIKNKSLNLENHNYSFKCLNNNLNFLIYKGTSELKFKLHLKNDGASTWPINQTLLTTDKSKSNIKIKDVILDPLNPREICDFYILFKNMKNLPEGKYYSVLEFKVGENKFGNNILINVEILQNPKEEYKEIIPVVRNEGNVDEDVASDTIIAVGLKKYKTIEGALQHVVENVNKS